MARYIRNPVINETPLDDEVFLVDPNSEEVYYPNEISGGLWRLLGEAMALDALQAAYKAAFPSADQRQVDARYVSARETPGWWSRSRGR